MGNVILILMQSRCCSENSTIARTTLRGLKRWSPRGTSFRNNNARAREIASKCPHNVAQARGPKIRPNLGASCRQSPKSPIPDLSSMHSNDVSCPYEHLLIGDLGVWLPTTATFQPVASRAAVGNSPLILDESSDHGLGQRYHHLDAIFRDR